MQGGRFTGDDPPLYSGIFLPSYGLFCFCFILSFSYCDTVAHYNTPVLYFELCHSSFLSKKYRGIMQRIRLSNEIRDRLFAVSAAIVKPAELSRNRRRGTSSVAPMIRLMGAGLYPIRLDTENIVRLQMLMQLVVNPNVDLTDPAQVGPRISELLALIAANQIKLIPK